MSVFLPLVRASVPSSKKVVLLMGKILSPCFGTRPSGSILLASQFHSYSSTNEPESNCPIEGVLLGKALDFQILEILPYRQQLRECAKKFAIRDERIAEGHDVDALDDANILKDS